MKAVAFTILVLATTVAGQVLHPVDLRRQADASHKTVEMPTLNLNSLPQPTRSQPVSPLTGQVRGAGTIETKPIETETLSRSTVPVTTLPRQNFAPKNAVEPARTVPGEPVKTQKADTSKRVIHPMTPSGTEELKKQLRSAP